MKARVARKIVVTYWRDVLLLRPVSRYRLESRQRATRILYRSGFGYRDRRLANLVGQCHDFIASRVARPTRITFAWCDKSPKPNTIEMHLVGFDHL